jgi:hypothetical protein
MAELVFKDGVFLLGAKDFSGQHNQMAWDASCDQQEITAFGDGTRKRLPGLLDVTGSLTGFYNSDSASTGGYDADAFSGVGSSDYPKVVAFGPDTKSTGKPMYFGNFNQASYRVGGTIGEVHTVDLTFEAHGDRMVLGTVAYNGSTTASANGPAITLGAASSVQSLYGAVNCLHLDGTLDIAIVSDTASTFPSGTTRMSFTQLTTQGAEFISTAGAITDTAYRVELTYTGSSGYEAVVTLGIR